MRIICFLSIIILIALGVSFALLNSQTVVINYYIGHRSMPLSLLLVLLFSAGCILGLIVAGWMIITTKMQNHNLRKRLKLADKEIENLRAIPLKDSH